MVREFKPVRFFVMMAVAAFIVCGVTAFYTKRAEHGRTAEERQAYWIGEKAGEQAPRDAKLPTPAELNMMPQKQFEQHGSGNKSDWDLAFEQGYEDGFQKTHPRSESTNLVATPPVGRSHCSALGITDSAQRRDCRGPSMLNR